MGKLETKIKDINSTLKTRSKSSTVSITEVLELLICLKEDRDEELNILKNEMRAMKEEQEHVKDMLNQNLQDMKIKLDEQYAKTESAHKKLQMYEKKEMACTIIIKGCEIGTGTHAEIVSEGKKLLYDRLKLPNIKPESVHKMNTRNKEPWIMMKLKKEKDKFDILKSTSKLKGSNVRISPWMTADEQQIHNHLLMERRKFITQNCTVRMKNNQQITVKNPNTNEETTYSSDGHKLTEILRREESHY